ncbi:MAG: cytochrome c [Desulfuromonadales bacterium]|nr:cytochrome c [Desulfuromonadales bacterium]
MVRFLLLILLIPIISCTERSSSYPNISMPAGFATDADRLAEAKQLFFARCVDCHGTLAEGRMSRADFFEPAAPDFTAPLYRQIDPAYLFWRIAEGKMVEPYLSQGSVMPAWGDHFSDEEIWSLVAYLQTRSRP